MAADVEDPVSTDKSLAFPSFDTMFALALAFVLCNPDFQLATASLDLRASLSLAVRGLEGDVDNAEASLVAVAFSAAMSAVGVGTGVGVGVGVEGILSTGGWGGGG